MSDKVDFRAKTLQNAKSGQSIKKTAIPSGLATHQTIEMQIM